MTEPTPAAIHQSLACEGVIRDLECEDCDDAACECECHFDPEEANDADDAATIRARQLKALLPGALATAREMIRARGDQR